MTTNQPATTWSESGFLFESLCDDIGPAKIVHVYEPESGLKAVVVVDNVACGPSIGGVRMAADVTTHEVFRLARAMTFKNAAAGLPHGGGKSGIIADPKSADKPRLMRAFGRAIRALESYIPGPDMGTDETCMGVLHDEIGRAVGLPRVFGGIPLDEIGATGYGLAQCAEVAAPLCGLDLQNSTVAIEGFGNVGQHAARFLEEMGSRLVAASDSGGAIFAPGGIAVADLMECKTRAGSVASYPTGETIPKEALFRVPCDVLVPAARPDSIRADTVADIQAKLILQGANIPATQEAETMLFERGVLVVPDFIANAGGVICAAVEYQGESEADAFREIAEKIRRNSLSVLERSRDEKVPPRRAALEMARERVLEAARYRRTS